MIDANFYNTPSKPNTLNKVLENAVVLRGLFFETFNEIRPKLEVRYNGAFNFNYCVVDGTAYFIENVSREKNDVLTIDLLLDVLQTYKTKLLSAVGTIVSRENANKFISNSEYLTDTRPKFRKLDFPNSGFFNEVGNIIMVTIKGDK